MSRPKPNVIMQFIDEKTGKSEQVIEANGIYVVCYEKEPISLKTFNAFYDYPGAKYKKTMFPNKAHAHNLADKLNTKFKTDKFTVELLTVK